MAIQAKLYKDDFGLDSGGYQYWMTNPSTNSNFCFQKQQQQPHMSQHKRLGLCFGKEKNGEHMVFGESIKAETEENQRQEIDGLINSQNERLRLALEGSRRQQMASILANYEAKMEILMKQKDQEIAKARNRNSDLEDMLRKMEIENQMWQRVANENVTLVESLNNTIQHIRENNAHFCNEAEDAESCCVKEEEENEPQNVIIYKDVSNYYNHALLM